MAKFRGAYTGNLDEKGRLNIPSKFRKVMSPEANDTFAICRAPDGCLRAYPLDIWELYENKLSAHPEVPELTRLRRLIHSTLNESTLDNQGRVTLTPPQMSIAGITKSVVLVGFDGFIEIWEPQRYEEYLQKIDNFNDVFYKVFSQE